jgi:hypothetical protein
LEATESADPQAALREVFDDDRAPVDGDHENVGLRADAANEDLPHVVSDFVAARTAWYVGRP